MKNKKDTSFEATTRFLFELGILAKTYRSAFPLLGSGKQSVAEHINRTCYIGLALAKLDGKVDYGKVILMCLLHDIAESRCSDLNYVYQQYVEVDEERIINEMTHDLPFAPFLKNALSEYEIRQSAEAIIAKEADNLEWILTLKEQLDLGNVRARKMIQDAQKRLKTDNAKRLAEEIMETLSDAWYTESKGDSWWINRTNSDSI